MPFIGRVAPQGGHGAIDDANERLRCREKDPPFANARVEGEVKGEAKYRIMYCVNRSGVGNEFDMATYSFLRLNGGCAEKLNVLQKCVYKFDYF